MFNNCMVSNSIIQLSQGAVPGWVQYGESEMVWQQGHCVFHMSPLKEIVAL